MLVLEAGGYRSESDFSNHEVPGYFELYLGGGLAGSESGSISILAGATLGGGTVVNYMNCVRTPDTILDEWERHGLEGLAQSAFVQDHVDVVMERLGANTEATTAERHAPAAAAGLRRARVRAPPDLAQRDAR